MTIEEKIKLYEEALKNIVHPISYLQKKADKEGRKLNGFASELIKLPSFYRGIAEDALKTGGINYDD